MVPWDNSGGGDFLSERRGAAEAVAERGAEAAVGGCLPSPAGWGALARALRRGQWRVEAGQLLFRPFPPVRLSQDFQVPQGQMSNPFSVTVGIQCWLLRGAPLWVFRRHSLYCSPK